jgi:dTDP-4-amino-4,6-dideoxygalactose transaminase
MLSLIPPVGNRIRLDDSAAQPFANRGDVRLFASGTAALAAALLWAKQRRGVSGGEVLLPAYGCPALVAAVLHAGLRPVLVDLAPSSPFLGLDALLEHCGTATVACVHVNFLGVEPPADSRTVTAAKIAHIYDSCQGWPVDGCCPAWAESTVVSFGRGKPITVGSGGAMLLKRSDGDARPATVAESQARGALSFRLRSALYNRVLWPHVFWWIDKVPGLHIGETNYRPLEAIEGMCAEARRHLDSNVAAYEHSDGWTVSGVESAIGLDPFGSFQLLPALHACDRGTRLLRLPVLAQSRQARDTAIARLRGAGYGATAMYRSPLWTFPGLESLRQYADHCPNATQFAERLLTLPLHGGVSLTALQDMTRRLQRI